MDLIDDNYDFCKSNDDEKKRLTNFFFFFFTNFAKYCEKRVTPTVCMTSAIFGYVFTVHLSLMGDI